MRCKDYYPYKKYIQFNDLVIDDFTMLKSADLSRSFKTVGHEYSFGHGSYTPFKARHQFSKDQHLSLTLKMYYEKFNRKQKPFFKTWLNQNLAKPGKLWAIEGNQLLWARAYVTDFSEVYSLEKNVLESDVAFTLYDGVWHKADRYTTFFKPYTSCDFTRCLDYREPEPCDATAMGTCCVDCLQPERTSCEQCLCQCADLDKAHSLCAMQDTIAKEYHKRCGTSWQIITNCEAAKRLFGDLLLGTKICKAESCKLILAGQFYSYTTLDSSEVAITLVGELDNPSITINGNTMQILGKYQGHLRLTSSGDIFYQKECCEEERISVENLIIPQKSTFGFLVHHGQNSLIVDTGNCCSMVCAYIKVGEITL